MESAPPFRELQDACDGIQALVEDRLLLLRLLAPAARTVLDDFHPRIDFLLEVLMVLAPGLHYLIYLKQLLLEGFNVLVVLKLDRAHLDDLLLEFLDVLLHLVVGRGALRVGGGHYFEGAALGELMGEGKLEQAAHFLAEGLQQQGFDFWAGGEGEDGGHALAVFLLDVVH